jgi:hypothetical protein
MPLRNITAGERGFLRSIFEETLPYPSLQVDTNDGDWGGHTNSITPQAIPYMSTTIWCADFSDPGVDVDDRSYFVHEFMHVWQYYHGVHKVYGFITQALWHIRDYERAYPYDLSDSDDILDFNFEQQAAIIQDFYLINENRRTKSNIGRINSKEAYSPYVDQVRSAGGPTLPWGARQSWVGPNVK